MRSTARSATRKARHLQAAHMATVSVVAACVSFSAAAQTLYHVGSASIPTPVSNGNIAVHAVDIYTPYPPSASATSWSLVQLAVTISHPPGLSFPGYPQCGLVTGPGTWFSHNTVLGTFDLHIEAAAGSLPGMQTSVIQVPMSVLLSGGAPCSALLIPGFYPWRIQVQGGTWTSIGDFIVGANLISAASLWLGFSGNPHIGTLFPFTVNLTSGGVGSGVPGGAVYYAVAFAFATGSFSDQFQQVFVPLAFDPMLVASVTQTWSCTPPFCPSQAVFINTVGPVNAAMQPQIATCYLQLPPWPALIGTSYVGAAAVLDPWWNLAGASQPVSFTVQP